MKDSSKNFFNKSKCTNKVNISGYLISDFTLHHVVYNKRFYSSVVAIPRTSGVLDEIPIIISEDVLEDIHLNSSIKGKYIKLTGSYRMYNNRNEINNKKFELYIFVSNYEILDSIDTNKYENNILLSGYICKIYGYRQTPNGKRIFEFLLAVKHNNKTYYIPCLAWENNAKILSKAAKVSTKIYFMGRIQSRSYYKKLNDGNSEYRTAQEVSIFYIARTE